MSFRRLTAGDPELENLLMILESRLDDWTESDIVQSIEHLAPGLCGKALWENLNERYSYEQFAVLDIDALVEAIKAASKQSVAPSH